MVNISFVTQRYCVSIFHLTRIRRSRKLTFYEKAPTNNKLYNQKLYVCVCKYVNYILTSHYFVDVILTNLCLNTSKKWFNQF